MMDKENWGRKAERQAGRGGRYKTRTTTGVEVHTVAPVGQPAIRRNYSADEKTWAPSEIGEYIRKFQTQTFM